MTKHEPLFFVPYYMAYDEYLAERVKRELTILKVPFEELKMMGGLCIKMEGKMLCGIIPEKKEGQNLLMARIGEEAYEKAMKDPQTLAMDFTGRPMKGFIFIKEEGYDLDEDLVKWLQLCIDHNPLAKASKKKKRKDLKS